MDKLVTLLDLCPSSSSHSTNLRPFCQVAFLSLKGAAMDSSMNGYANWCKLKVDMSMHHAYDKSWKQWVTSACLNFKSILTHFHPFFATFGQLPRLGRFCTSPRAWCWRSSIQGSYHTRPDCCLARRDLHVRFMSFQSHLCCLEMVDKMLRYVAMLFQGRGAPSLQRGHL